MSKNCPNCGHALPEEAAFCPYCSTSLNRRQVVKAPSVRGRRLGRWLLLGALLAVLALAGGIALSRSLAPQRVDGLGEVLYTDDEGTYQLVLGWPSDHFTPVEEMYQTGEAGEDYRFPSRMYINHLDSGADAGPLFRRKVASCTAALIQPEDTPFPISCSAPEPMDFDPGAAYITLVDLKGDSAPGELVFTLEMVNGDVITLRQRIVMDTIRTVSYGPEDYPMDTVADLEALLELLQITEDAETVIDLHLPPVTYTEPLSIRGRSLNLLGSTAEDGSRTTFTQTLEVHMDRGALPYVQDIDFVGSGSGVGLSSSRNLHVVGCSFTGWRTGLLAHGTAWVNVQESFFADNEIGFHFNSGGSSVTHTEYAGDRFEHNGTAILLEQVPTDVGISFPQCEFTANAADIDNRCGQEVDTSKASFR